MRSILVMMVLMAAVACTPRAESGTTTEFPFPTSLPTSVKTKGPINYERSGKHAFELGAKKELVEGKKWSGHIQVSGVAPHDAAFLGILEKSLVEKTGWEVVHHDEKSDPPMATLRRTLGGEFLWISFEGWPDDVTVTLAHR